MKKIVNVKEATELELQFQDGKIINLRFDVSSLLNFNNLDGGLENFFKDASIPEMCAKIVYITGANHNDGLTIDESRKIVSNMDPLTITEIINEFSESMGMAKNELQGELQKKLMTQFLAALK